MGFVQDSLGPDSSQRFTVQFLILQHIRLIPDHPVEALDNQTERTCSVPRNPME